MHKENVEMKNIFNDSWVHTPPSKEFWLYFCTCTVPEYYVPKSIGSENKQSKLVIRPLLTFIDAIGLKTQKKQHPHVIEQK